MDSFTPMPDHPSPGVIMIDAGRKIVFADERAAGLLALDRLKMLGRSWTELCPGMGNGINPAPLEEENRNMVLQSVDTGPDNPGILLIQDVSTWRVLWDEFQKYREAARDLEAIFNSSFDEILVIDGQGVIQRINKAGETNYGMNAGEMTGSNVRELENRGFFGPSVTSLVLKDRCRVTITQKTKTGKQLIVTGNPIFDDNNNISRVVINSRDISELTNLQQKLEDIELLAENYYKLILNLQQRKVIDAEIVCASPQMKRIIDLADKVAPVDSTVLITGESGVGKGLIAARIHEHSPRCQAPFTPINCGAIPETLLESELFGYERGAFTGANKEGKKGLIEVSQGGTVFLDEVADLPLNIQVKLLNLIQEKTYYRVGGNRQVGADIRFIAATNRNIRKMVEDGTFREDLYYRLNVIPLVILPLRYRREDIAPLVNYFLQQLNIRFNTNKKTAPGVARIFGAYDWPGNVRELENILERLMVTCDEELITESHLPDYMLVDRASASKVAISDLCPLREAREEIERQLITMAYRKFHNTYDVALALGINQSTAVRKIHKYRLTDDPMLNVKVRERGRDHAQG